MGKRDGNHSLGGVSTRDKEEEGSRGRSADRSFQELCLGGHREMGQWAEQCVTWKRNRGRAGL